MFVNVLLFYCRVGVRWGTGLSLHLSVPKHLEVWAVLFICVSPPPGTLWVLMCSLKARPNPGRHPQHQMSLLLCVLFQKGQKPDEGSHSPETLNEDFREILSSLCMSNHCLDQNFPKNDSSKIRQIHIFPYTQTRERETNARNGKEANLTSSGRANLTLI